MDLVDLYPAGNEEVVWTVGIAMYIFLSGMSGGAFILGASADALGKKQYAPLAKLGVVSALILLALAPIFLILDLSQPLRAYYTLLYPNPASVMSFGVFLLTLYGMVVGLYALLLFRRDLVHITDKLRPAFLQKPMRSVLAIARLDDLSEASVTRDALWAGRLAKLGVVLALALASYTGFILAVVAARDMWHSALIPVLFLFSALVSGTALLLVLKYLQDRLTNPKGELDLPLLTDLGTRLRHLFVEDVAFLLFWLITLDHSGRGGQDSLWLLTQGPFQGSFLGLQVFVGSLIPLALLYHPKVRDRPEYLVLGSLLILVGIAAMRYNIVIGGQALPMSRGELVEYSMSGYELTMTVLIFLSLALLFLLSVRVLPLDYPFAKTLEPTGSQISNTQGENGHGPGGLGPDQERRDFLKTSGAALVLVTVGGWGPRQMANLIADGTPGTLSASASYAMVIDLNKCIGCHGCTQACKKEYDLPSGYWRSWVKKMGRSGGDQSSNFYLPRLCNQCAEPPCVPVCPVQATYLDETGIIRQRDDRCIGCKYCIVACPYSARFVNPDTKVVEKCDFCYDLLLKGREPACVEACPAGARIFGDLQDPDLEVTKLVNTQPWHTLKPELGTEPQVFYIGADEQIMKGGKI